MNDVIGSPQVPSRDERTWAMLCHLSSLLGFIFPVIGQVVAPLVIWLIKKEDMPFVDDQGKESINFQISILIYAFISFLLVFLGVGILLLMFVGFVQFVMTIVASISANDGKQYRYPYIFRLIK
ncbi:DUF4870 domain-containing protein [Heliobacterium chlorum]|uniref:DUF4870 domain-containing protein n=1 Tax=Heliobacterium chlorum TaxID=2698 RepID=A0ABR7T6K5_HELCL|nr:DUF4870 domain-containing protein [Heliobacterium chlorum]MBC9786286.1 DUF4870 domain-containing protein [Heliobacterium chlorum]